jgi:hypothetical protein
MLGADLLALVPVPVSPEAGVPEFAKLPVGAAIVAAPGAEFVSAATPLALGASEPE